MCGVFGIHGHDEAANIAYLGMHALQHRGQESAGLVAVDDGKLRRHVAMGLVVGRLRPRRRSRRCRATPRSATSATRPPAAPSCATPSRSLFEYAGGAVAIAHNGNLVNADELRAELEAQGSIFQTSSDTEVIVHLMAQAREPDVARQARRRARAGCAARTRWSSSPSDGKMIAVRDPNGFRPLVLGRLKDAYVLSSETCAFDLDRGRVHARRRARRDGRHRRRAA